MRVLSPLWALLFFIPVTLMASVDMDQKNTDTAALTDNVTADVANADLNLEDGAVDGHRRWGRGWGRGWGWGGGWGGWGYGGWGYPYYGYSYWPYYGGWYY